MVPEFVGAIHVRFDVIVPERAMASRPLLAPTLSPIGWPGPTPTPEIARFIPGYRWPEVPLLVIVLRATVSGLHGSPAWFPTTSRSSRRRPRRCQ